SQGWPRQPFENFPLGIGSRHDPDAEQRREKQPRRVVWINILGRRAIELGCREAAAKESFDASKLRRDHCATSRVVRCNLQRRIDQETPLTLPVLERMLDDLAKETFERPARRQRLLEPAQPVARGVVEIAFQCSAKQLLLVAEAVVE